MPVTLHLKSHSLATPAMAAPASLSLRPCAGLSPGRTERPLFPKRPPLLSFHRAIGSHLLSNSRSLSLARAAVSLGSNRVGSPPPAEQSQEKSRKYYFLVANAKFMLDEEEHFQEQLFEKRRNYEERNKEHDFWLVIEPKFLDKFPNITARLKRPAVALVSTDANWMTFMKLRLDRVLGDNFEAESLEEALDSSPVDLQFEKPEKWTAPYPKYESGWWEPFLPLKTSKTTA